MRLNIFAIRMCCLTALLAIPVITGWAADPGDPPPTTAEVSDQKPGSVLVYPYYTSSAASPTTENTRVALTNHHNASSINIHIFFVSGNEAIDGYGCLTPNQTFYFLISDIDPAVTGLIVAVAVGAQGQPINFNFLTGEASVKLASGHRASFKAEAIAAIAANPTAWMAGNTTATLNFDGVSYNRLPRTLTVDKLKSAVDGNVSILAIAHVGGNYALSPTSGIGLISGTVFNDGSQSSPFALTTTSVQIALTLSDSAPRTIPPYTQLIPAGRNGWLKLAADTEIGLFGVLLNFNANTGSNPRAFTGGHNLRKLTLAANTNLTIPTSAPAC